jgi:prephenate dehydratase
MKIMALGPAGTNGHEAANIARQLVDWKDVIPDIEFSPRNAAILETALAQKCWGVVPVENSTAGLVSEVVKDFWIARGKNPGVYVVGEIELPVEHCLLVEDREGFALGDVNEVVSHPQALAQCARSLDALGIALRTPAASTALAAKKVSSGEKGPAVAAIASRFAAKTYGLRILKEGMEDVRGNATRFHVIGPKEAAPTGKDRTALIFHAQDKPRALLDCMWALCTEGTNLSSIHSIPLGLPGRYAFYCEFDRHLATDEGSTIMGRLGLVASGITILGSFPQARKGGAS